MTTVSGPPTPLSYPITCCIFYLAGLSYTIAVCFNVLNVPSQLSRTYEFSGAYTCWSPYQLLRHNICLSLVLLPTLDPAAVLDRTCGSISASSTAPSLLLRVVSSQPIESWDGRL